MGSSVSASLLKVVAMKERHAPSLRFCGATDTVTGSRHLVESKGTRVLVDCGLFQGFKRIRDRNRSPFPVPPRSIDAVLLTHPSDLGEESRPPSCLQGTSWELRKSC